MIKVDSGYEYSVDAVNEVDWNKIILEFNDSSFYHTFSYGKIIWGVKQLSNLVLKHNGEVVGVAQLRIKCLPFLKIGIAHMLNPCWKKKGKEINYEHLKNLLRAIKIEYVNKRKLYLNINARNVEENKSDIIDIYRKENFRLKEDDITPVLIKLDKPIEKLLKNLGRGWRDTLKRSKKIAHEYIEGNSDELADKAIDLILEMKRRKNYAEFGTMEDLIRVHKDLPEENKLHFIFTFYENEPVSMIGFSKTKPVGQLLVAATGNRALKLKANHPIYWKMIEYYKNNNYKLCDLGGSSKSKNPGGHYFKTGLAGKNRFENKYLGKFVLCESILNLIAFDAVFKLREYNRRAIIYTKELIKKIKNKK
jgi:hypothetical protein